MKRLLCFIGIHDYTDNEKQNGGLGTDQTCARCGQKRVVIRAIMESDLRKMLMKKEISFKGYSAAIKRGYLQKSDFELKDDFDLGGL